jgi:hypothetical protein
VTVRGVDWAAVLGGSAVGAAILAGCVPFAADGPPLEYVRLALVALVAAAAFVLDEPAAAAVDAVPQTRRQRTAARSLAVTAPLVVWTVGIVALELRNATTPALALLVEGVGVLAVTVALAAGLRFAGRNEPGEVVASVLGAAMLAVLIFNPPPRSVPFFPVDAGWAASSVLWGCLAVAAVMLVVAVSRDPYRR